MLSRNVVILTREDGTDMLSRNVVILTREDGTDTSRNVGK
jgi:hypothetical protein